MNFSLFGVDLRNQVVLISSTLGLDGGGVPDAGPHRAVITQVSWTCCPRERAGPQTLTVQGTAQRCPTHQVMSDGHQQQRRGHLGQPHTHQPKKNLRNVTKGNFYGIVIETAQ